MGHHVDLPRGGPVRFAGLLAALPGHAGVRAEQVDLAEHLPGHADERGHAALGGSVTGHGGGPAGRGDRGCRPGVDVIDDHPATLGDEAAGKRGADPAARPGHHHAGTGYRLHHGSFRKILKTFPHRERKSLQDHGWWLPGATGRFTRVARAARCRSGVPNAIAPLLARLSSRCAGCSQVNPMPPCICTLGQGGRDRRVRTAVGQAGGRVPGGGPGLGQLHPHVGEPVLERLEGADRPGELPPFLHVGDGHVEAALRGAELLGGEHGRAGGQGRRHRLGGDRTDRHGPGWHVRQGQVAQGPGGVQRDHGRPGDARRTGVDRVEAERHAVGGHQQHVGEQRVRDTGHGSGQPRLAGRAGSVTRLCGAKPHPGGQPRTGRGRHLGESHRQRGGNPALG